MISHSGKGDKERHTDGGNVQKAKHEGPRQQSLEGPSVASKVGASYQIAEETFAASIADPHNGDDITFPLDYHPAPPSFDE